MTARMTLDLPDDLDAAVLRIATQLRERGRSDITPELLAAALIRIGLGAATAEALDSPEALDRLGKRVIDLFVRGELR